MEEKIFCKYCKEEIERGHGAWIHRKYKGEFCLGSRYIKAEPDYMKNIENMNIHERVIDAIERIHGTVYSIDSKLCDLGFVAKDFDRLINHLQFEFYFAQTDWSPMHGEVRVKDVITYVEEKLNLKFNGKEISKKYEFDFMQALREM